MDRNVTSTVKIATSAGRVVCVGVMKLAWRTVSVTRLLLCPSSHNLCLSLFPRNLFFLMIIKCSLFSFLAGRDVHRKRRQMMYRAQIATMAVAPAQQQPASATDVKEWLKHIMSAHSTSFIPVSDVFTSKVMALLLHVYLHI